MKKLLLFLISFLGIFSACHREPVEPTPGDWSGDSNVCLYGTRTAVYELKAAVDAVVAAEGKRESAAVEESVGLGE